MAKKYLSAHVKFLTFLLGLLGFTTSCEDTYGPLMYGSPPIEFKTKGTVVKQESDQITPVKGIKVILEFKYEYEREGELKSVVFGDTLYTNSSGEFDFRDSYPKSEGIHTLKFEDIDGATNGGEFEYTEVVVDYSNINANPSGTYSIGSVILNPKTEEPAE